jgi:transcription initiation protein SPT3
MSSSISFFPAKRFREFLNLPSTFELKASDDTVDIVGFLAFEIVRSLTLAGLAVKKSLEEAYLRDDYTAPILGKRKAGAAGGPAEKRRREGSPDDDAEYTLPVNSLFLPPAETKTPLRPEHIQDAFARMQGEWSHSRSAGMHNWRGGLVRTKISLI